jgi:hypothetical protein
MSRYDDREKEAYKLHFIMSVLFHGLPFIAQEFVAYLAAMSRILLVQYVLNNCTDLSAGLQVLCYPILSVIHRK